MNTTYKLEFYGRFYSESIEQTNEALDQIKASIRQDNLTDYYSSTTLLESRFDESVIENYDTRVTISYKFASRSDAINTLKEIETLGQFFKTGNHDLTLKEFLE